MTSEDDAIKMLEQFPTGRIQIKSGEEEYSDVPSRQTNRKETSTTNPLLETTTNGIELRLINLEEIRKSENYGVKKYTDAVYEGDLQNGKRHGLGIMRYSNGRFYEGGWANDLRDGKGYERYSNGNTYEGDFSKGKAQGKGVYKWNNGEIYDGEWHHGLKHGDGVWKGNQGDSYIGEWRNSKAEGYGVHIWTNGDRYEGEWKECLKHGNGTDIFANGDIYIGQYKFGKPCGYGQYIWKNGSTYTGEFQNGLKNGFGKYRKSKESRTNMYEGQYFRDKKQGFGIFKWASGNMYRGQYREDEREGIGEMKWTDGSIYIGQWERGIQHGYGKMIFPDGTVKEGFFDNNVYKGPAKRSAAPPEFQDPAFDVMSLAPQDVLFSEEIRSFYPAVRPQGESPSQRFPTATYEEYEESAIGRDTKYSMPPLPAPNRHKTRSFTKDPRPFIINRPMKVPKTGTSVRSASTISRSKTGMNNSSRGLSGHLSAKMFKRSPPSNATTLYAPSYTGISPLRPRPLLRHNRQKRAWVPSGKVHYKDQVVVTRPKYFT